MTELRDVRLRKALEEAPDAGARPHARTRDAIRGAAHDAVTPAWRRWWRRGGQGGTPWAAAFATIALATLVVVMWEGQEVPGARPEATVAQAPAPAAPMRPEAGVAPAAAPVPAPLPAPAAAPQPQALPAPATQPRPRVQGRVEPAPASLSAAAPAAPAPPPAPAPAPADAAAPLAEAPAATQAARDEARSAPAAAPSAPPPSVAAAAPQRQAAPAAPGAFLRAAPPAVEWTQVRIEANGRSVVVPLAQAGRLPALVTRLLQAEAEPGGPAAGTSLRLELARGDEALGVLEKVGERWRWTPLRDAQQARTLRADPALSEAVREEAEALLRR
jgi:hypothetical protein